MFLFSSVVFLLLPGDWFRYLFAPVKL